MPLEWRRQGTVMRRAPHAANGRKRGSVQHTRGGGGTPDRGAPVGGPSMAMSLGPAACYKQEQGMIRRRTKQGNTLRCVGIETNTQWAWKWKGCRVADQCLAQQRKDLTFRRLYQDGSS
jgi:hypothetical protein